MIAARYLRSRRRERFISVIAMFSLIGIALGVATLIVVMAVMNGFRTEITKKILGLNGHITVSPYLHDMTDYQDVSLRIEALPEILSASAIINGQAMATTDTSNIGIAVKGVDRMDLAKRPMIADSITIGSLDDFSGKSVIMIGSHLAASLGVFVGDEVTFISPQGRVTAIGTLPRLKTYEVVALFESGMFEYDSSVAFMPLEAAQLFFQYGDAVSAIEVVTKDADRVAQVGRSIYDALGQMYVVQDWQMLNASLFNALKVERTVMFLILTLIVCVAAFNIISSLIMLVNDKARDIAILRTMGVSKAAIIRIFFMCGAAIGVIGTLLGFILGLGFALNVESIRSWIESLTGNTLFDPMIYFLSELPVEIRQENVMWAVAVGLVFSFLATLYPAFKAARQDPAEALRYE